MVLSAWLIRAFKKLRISGCASGCVCDILNNEDCLAISLQMLGCRWPPREFPLLFIGRRLNKVIRELHASSGVNICVDFTDDRKQVQTRPPSSHSSSYCSGGVPCLFFAKTAKL